MSTLRSFCLVIVAAICCGALYAQTPAEFDVSYDIGTSIGTANPIASGGSIDLGTNSDKVQQHVTLRLENTGGSTLNLLGTTNDYLQASGVQNVNYVIQQPGSSTIAAGTFVDVTIDVTPNGDGSWQLLITIPNDDSNESTYTVLLKGSGGKKKKDSKCSTGEDDDGSLLILLGVISAALVGLRLRGSRA